MAFYAEEEEVWKCTQHPSKRRRSGICPSCLKDRLSALCPDCANVRPCSCCATSTTSSSSSASSSFSLQFSDVASVGRIATLIDNEPSFRRSKSTAFPFFRSARFSGDRKIEEERENGKGRKSIWSSLFKRREKMEDIEVMKMRRSKSVAASITAENEMLSAMRSASPAVASKGKAWYFPSPMKVFRHSKGSTKVGHERSPLHRG